MTKTKRKLPDKPSELLQMAMDDLEDAEKSDEYSIDMGHWYFPNVSRDGVKKECRVCLAGAVMANMLPSDRKKSCSPNTLKFNDVINGKTRDKLMAIDEFRSGFIESAVNRMGFSTANSGIPSYLNLSGYIEEPDTFKEEMQLVIQTLKDEGY